MTTGVMAKKKISKQSEERQLKNKGAKKQTIQTSSNATKQRCERGQEVTNKPAKTVEHHLRPTHQLSTLGRKAHHRMQRIASTTEQQQQSANYAPAINPLRNTRRLGEGGESNQTRVVNSGE